MAVRKIFESERYNVTRDCIKRCDKSSIICKGLRAVADVGYY